MVYFFDMQNKYLIVINTCPDAQSAESMASTLVERGLAACINIIPNIRSVYVWKGERVTGDEHLLLIKTLATCYSELETTIQSLHPYELPEIIAVPIETGLPGYLAWIGDIRK